MALLFMDGFEYATADIAGKWDTGNATSSAQARTGTRSAFQSGWVKSLPASGSTVLFGAAFYTAAAVEFNALTVRYDGAAQFAVTVGASGLIKVNRENSAGTLIASASSGTYRHGGWNFLEVKVLLDQSAGTVLVTLNGTAVITATGLDTCHQTHQNWNQIALGSASTYFDDLYVCDGSGAVNNALLGEIRVVTLFPQTDAVAAGSNAQFTCSGGTDHGALVDDDPSDGDTTYLSSSTAGHIDSWHYPALGYTGSIKGVQMNLLARKAEAGPRAIAAVTRPVATNRIHATDHYLGTTYLGWRAIWELNPEDSAAWEVADVDGAEFGVKVSV